MSTKQEPDVLSPEEADFIHRVADLYAPPPMTPTQRAALNDALEKRLSRSARVSFLRPVAVVATACVAAPMWLTMPHQSNFLPSEGPSSEIPIIPQEKAAAVKEEGTLLLYAYYSPESYDEAKEGDSEDEDQFFLDEYEALATVFAVPDT